MITPAVVPGALLLMAVVCSSSVAAQGTSRLDPQAAPSLKTLSLEALGNIEVTTNSKEPEPVRRVPAAIHVITRDDIRRSGATTLAEALRLAPGVDVARADSNHWSIGIRGFGDQFSKSVLLLIDGRSAYTPLFAGVFWSVQDTLIEDIERIEVIRGPGGTIWGANAVNGIINVITRHAKDTHGVLVTAGTGNVEYGVGGVRYGGGNGTSFDYRVYGKGFNRGPEHHQNGDPEFDGWKTGQAGFRADWTRQRDTVTLSGDLYKGAHGGSTAVALFSPPSQSKVYGPLDAVGGNLVARWRRDLGKGSDITGQVYYDRTSLQAPQLGEWRDTFDADFIHRLTVRSRHELIWGLGLRVSPSEINQKAATIDFVPHERTASTYSAFAQDQIAVARDRLWLTLGAKIEDNNYTGVEVQPTVRLLWTPAASRSFWSSVTRAVRTPSRLERDVDLTSFVAPSPLTYLRVLGNSDFHSEELVAYEIGFRQSVTSTLYVDVAAFHNEHNYLGSFGSFAATIETSPAPIHVLLTFPYENGIKGSSDGIEIAPEWRPANWWRLTGAYSYLNIDLENRPGYTNVGVLSQYEGSSPHHKVQVQSRFTIRDTWEIDQSYRYVSALPARQVDDYATLDLRVGRFVGKQLELSVIGQNLLDAHHAEFGHDPPPTVEIRRSVYAQLTWRR